MDLLYELLAKASDGRSFSPSDKQATAATLDRMYPLLEARRNPPGFRLATGSLATGATGRVALNAYFLLLGRKALGVDYTKRDPRMAYWSTQLAFHIVLGNFNGRFEKGLYCCSTCTLSVLPLYCVGAFDMFDCGALKENVVDALAHGRPPFARPYNRRYADWALKFV